MKTWTCAAAVLVVLSGATSAADNAGDASRFLPNARPFPDPHGSFATVSATGSIPTTGAFFQDLGSNGRRCVTCHQASDAWTVIPEHVQQRFNQTEGRDPIFRSNDGANCPTADVSTLPARRRAYSLLLSKGLIRVGLTPPSNAEFSVISVDNPHGCTDTSELSVYRRVLPTTNLPFLSTVMWDARETFKDSQGKFIPVLDDLAHQAVSATLGHAQAAQSPTQAQVNDIVAFEIQLFTAQTQDQRAGPLDRAGAKGGPATLATQDFFLGINDPLGGNPTGLPFSSVVFSLYTSWLAPPGHEDRDRREARQAIARGERLFNTQPIEITGVKGLNDVPLQDGKIHPSIPGFCGTCHDSPNVGDHSVPAPLDIGIADASRRSADLPLITLMRTSTGELIQTTDPGRALITGKWADIGKFKGPILRAVGARAPYFHNGSAATLLDVVTFYDTRFTLRLSDRDKSDLVAFLATL